VLIFAYSDYITRYDFLHMQVVVHDKFLKTKTGQHCMVKLYWRSTHTTSNSNKTSVNINIITSIRKERISNASGGDQTDVITVSEAPYDSYRLSIDDDDNTECINHI